MTIKDIENRLPTYVTVAIVDSSNLPAYRRLITTLLPIRYPDKFYRESISDPKVSGSIALCALYREPDVDSIESQNEVIAGIQARLEPVPINSSTTDATNSPHPFGEEYTLYIQTLCTLAPYRRLRIASALLHELITTTLNTHRDKRITSVYAHVWEANEEALEWYTHRGFETGETLKGYYRRLKPDGARVVRRTLVVDDHLAAKRKSDPVA